MSAPIVATPVAVSERLVEATAALLERVTSNTPTVLYASTGRDVRLEAPVTFPDGIGSGSLIVQLHAQESIVDFTLRLEHDRVFATPQRTPSPNRCFLNDYVASLTLAADVEDLPEEFVREVVSGVSAARYAVERHNREHPAPWFRVSVTVRDEALV